MPSETEMLEHVLVRTKDRKFNKKCKDNKCHGPEPKPCDVDCCIPDCNPDCCTPGFQRLDKLRQVWQLTQYNLALPTSVYNRAGQSVAVPETYGSLESAAFSFVNEVRYLNYEECGKLDQVTGWSVDLQTGDLYFYQNLPDLGLSTSDSRATLLNTAPTSLTPYDRRKLQEMEPFWKLSLKAVERVRENPKTEGNICEIKDKCGNKFLVAINRADGQSPTNSVCDYNSQYSIVVVKLC